MRGWVLSLVNENVVGDMANLQVGTQEQIHPKSLQEGKISVND